MDIQQYLQEIKPDLTLYGVLLTFGFLSLLAGRFFWRYERELIQDNVNRLRSLMDGFRTQHIEPVLEEQLLEVAEASYREALEDLRDEVAENTPSAHAEAGDGRTQPKEGDVPSYTLPVRMLDARIESGHRGRLPKGLEEFFTSATGEKFFESLDRLYNEKYSISDRYRSAKISCTFASYAFLLLGFLLLLGLTQIVYDWPIYFLYPWLSLCGIVLLTAAGLSVRMEYQRHALIGQWESLQIYGRI